MTKLKDHEIRGVVNELTTIAQTYGSTQQCRDMIAHKIVPILKNHEIIHCPEKNRKQFEEYVRAKYHCSNGDSTHRDSNGIYTKYVTRIDNIAYSHPVKTLWEVWNHGNK